MHKGYIDQDLANLAAAAMRQGLEASPINDGCAIRVVRRTGSEIKIGAIVSHSQLTDFLGY